MFCPNCGANNSTEQKFCRSCGLNLEAAAQSLLEQIPSAANAGLLKRKRALEKFGGIAFTGLGIAILSGIIGLIYLILTKMVLSGSSPAAGLILILFVIFAALTLAYVFMNETLKKKGPNPEMTRELGKGDETGKLLEEGHFEAASVTVRTTDLLYPENKTRPLE